MVGDVGGWERNREKALYSWKGLAVGGGGDRVVAAVQRWGRWVDVNISRHREARQIQTKKLAYYQTASSGLA